MVNLVSQVQFLVTCLIVSTWQHTVLGLQTACIQIQTQQKYMRPDASFLKSAYSDNYTATTHAMYT